VRNRKIESAQNKCKRRRSAARAANAAPRIVCLEGRCDLSISTNARRPFRLRRSPKRPQLPKSLALGPTHRAKAQKPPVRRWRVPRATTGHQIQTAIRRRLIANPQTEIPSFAAPPRKRLSWPRTRTADHRPFGQIRTLNLELKL
jgi:hypothetical protein